MLFQTICRILVLSLLLSFTAASYSQNAVPPQGISFQAVARDPMGNPARQRVVHIKNTLLKNSANGPVLYAETHEVRTSSEGVFSIIIGKGKAAQGAFSAVSWGSDLIFFNLKVAVAPSFPMVGWDKEKSYQDMGTTQFWSVPYALFAGTLDDVSRFVMKSDTAALLRPYARRSDLTVMDNRISQKLSVVDTATMLSGYQRKLALSPVAASGSYSDLSNKPQLFSGDYNDLRNKPQISVAPVQSVNGQTGAVMLDKNSIGLNNADNTSDINKPLSVAAQQALSSKVDVSRIAAANGVASLDAGGKVPSAQLPALSFTSVFIKNSPADMLALGVNSLKGTVCVRADVTKSYILSVDNSANITDWIELQNAGAAVASVNGQVGTVSLTTADITEINNLYFTVARARAALSAATPLQYNSATGEISADTASALHGLVTKGFLQSRSYSSIASVNGKLNIADTAAMLNPYQLRSSAFDGNYNSLTNKPALATVAASGNYNDLQNKPSLFNGDYAALTNKPTLFDGDYNNLTNKPTIPTPYNLPVASASALGGVKIGRNLSIDPTTGVLSAAASTQLRADWAQADSTLSDFIRNKPSLFSGSYNDLQNKPTLFNGDYNALSNKPSIPAAQVAADWNATSGVAQILNKPTLATVATSGNYNDLTNKPSIPGQVAADWNATSGAAQILNKPSIPAAQVAADWNATSGVSQILNKPTLSTVATSGSYADLSGKPSLATVATSGSYADLSNKPTIPAAQVSADWSATSGIAQILNKPTLATVATSGNYDDLSNKLSFSAGTSGTDFNIAATGNAHTLNLPSASASHRGLLTSTDWSLFDGKQAALNGTGLVRMIGTTLTYDNSAYLTADSAGRTYLLRGGDTLSGHLRFNADNTLDIGDATAVRPRSGYFGTSVMSPVFVGGTTTSSAIRYRTTTNAGLAGADHIFETGFNGSNEAMRILHDGKIGMGTPAPGYKLSVESMGTLASFFSSDLSANQYNEVIIGKEATDRNAANIRFNYATNASDMNRLSLGFWQKANLLNIRADGYVGIGTTTPGNKLEIDGTGGTGTGLKLPAGAAAGKVLTSDVSGNASWQTASVVVYSEIHGTGNGTNYNANTLITGLSTTKADNVKALYGSTYGWDNTNKRWVAPFTGKYRVTINGYFNPITTVNPRIYAYKNGNQNCGIVSVSQPSGSNDISSSTSAIISLDAGDYVEFRAGPSAEIRLYMGDYHTFIRVESVE